MILPMVAIGPLRKSQRAQNQSLARAHTLIVIERPRWLSCGASPGGGPSMNLREAIEQRAQAWRVVARRRGLDSFTA
jgi:hypothetical protein